MGSLLEPRPAPFLGTATWLWFAFMTIVFTPLVLVAAPRVLPVSGVDVEIRGAVRGRSV